MPKFIVKQYHLYTVDYEVDAPTRADAIVTVLNAEGKEIEDSKDLIHTECDYGMDPEEFTEEEIKYIQKQANWKFDHDHVETIASVEEVKEQE